MVAPFQLKIAAEITAAAKRPTLSMGRGISPFGARNFPHLAGRRSAVWVISTSVFWRSPAALDAARSTLSRGI